MSATATTEAARTPRVSRDAARGVLAEVRSPPNLLTAARLVLVVVLWGFALTGHSVVLGIGLGLAFLTDVADGYGEIWSQNPRSGCSLRRAIAKPTRHVGSVFSIQKPH